jgi:hypothetical protein
MTAVSYVPDVSRQEIAVGAWHHVSLEATFCHKKAASKPSKDAFYAILIRESKKLRRSEPVRIPKTPKS